MMQRSYRSLVTNITRGFLKKNKNDNNVSSTNNQSQKTKQETLNVLSQIIKQSKQSTHQQNRNRSPDSHKNKKSQKNRDYRQKQPQQGKQVLGEKRKDHWQQRKEKSEVNQNSAQQRRKPRYEDRQEIKQEQAPLVLNEKNAQKIAQLKKQLDNFQILVKENTIQGQLNSHLENINQLPKSEDFFNLIVLYLQTNVHQASTYYTNNVLKALIKNIQVRLNINKIEQKIILAYLINQDLEGLEKFSTILKGDYSKKGKKLEYGYDNIIQILQTLSESRECPQKYRILTNILGLIKIKQQQKVFLARFRFLMRSYMQNFVKKYKVRDQRDQKLQSAFEQSLAAMERGNLFQATFFNSDSIIQYLQIVYFNQCSKPEKLKNFIDLISRVKFPSDGQAKLVKFFYKWYNSLINFTINSTDCQAHPFLVNSQLIKNYEGFFKEKKIEGVLVIVAICLSNKYLTIPIHFLENYKNIDWKIEIKKDITKMIQSEVDVISLLQNKQQKQRAQKSKNTFDRIRMYIILKDYEKAMQIYNQFYFKKECIKKQRQIIKEVFTKRAISQLSDEKINTFFTDLNHFADNLSEEYLWESWKKSEDLGYMLEDYYIKEEDPKESQAKIQKRFSFWDKYFQTKRVNEINRFQRLNQLQNLKQPNKEALVQGQFNLNNFLSEQNYSKYKQEAIANENKARELQLFLYQAEEAILSEDVESKGPGLLSMQSTMCEQNLKILQEFGLKDYDLSVHDKEQFKIRFNNLKKHRGVMRKQGTLKLKNQMREKIHQAFSVAPKQKFVEEKKKERAPRQKKTVKVVAEGQDAQLMEEASQVQVAAEVQEQVAEEKGQEQVGQIQQQIAQEKEEKQQQVVAQQKVQLQVVEEVKQPKKQIDIFTKQFVDQLRIKKRNQFRKAAINISIEAHPMVNQLISWGVLNKKPMAIYMGQKLAMVTGQIIPHNLAIRVSDLLSHSRQIQKQLIADCKVCLSHIGQINREFIYLSNYKYHHIPFRPYLSELVLNMNKPIRERLIDLVGQNPNLMDMNREPREEWKRALKNSNSIF